MYLTLSKSIYFKKILTCRLSCLFLFFICTNSEASNKLGEILLLPELSYKYVIDESNDNDIKIDTFYLKRWNRFDILLEGVVSTKEAEIERIQFGSQINNDVKLWLGRYHNPLGYWNTTFHHGAYFQNSISRPAISNFEDDGGILPMHILGLLLDGSFEFSEKKINYQLGFGLGSEREEDGKAESSNIYAPSPEKHDKVITLNLSYYPVSYENSAFGIFVSKSVAAKHQQLFQVSQTISGFYFNQELQDLRLLGAWYLVYNSIESSNSTISQKSKALQNAYIQFEINLHRKLIAYSRIEKTANESNQSIFDNIFTDFITDRESIGLRFELPFKQAMALEISETHTRANDITSLTINWSAAWP